MPESQFDQTKPSYKLVLCSSRDDVPLKFKKEKGGPLVYHQR
jgi:hypothetical protein